jgi:hypothetical protein
MDTILETPIAEKLRSFTAKHVKFIFPERALRRVIGKKRGELIAN